MATRIIQAFPAAPARSARFSVRKALAVIAAMLEARHTRRLLAEMDTRMLADIGTSPSDARMEAARPFWDLR